MKKLLPILLLSISLTALGQEFEFTYHKDFEPILKQTNDTASELYYDKLLLRFQKNDTTLTDFEVLALLIGFTDNEHFQPYSYSLVEKDIYKLNEEGKYEEAIDKSNDFLKLVPVSQETLIEKSYSFYKLGQKDSAQYYAFQFRRIMEAMGQSGDGLSPETAFFSLGPADGQNFIRKYLRAKIGAMGSSRDTHGNFIDILEIILEDQKSGEAIEKNLYFQIEHATKTMFQDFKPKNSAKKGKKKKEKQKKE